MSDYLEFNHINRELTDIKGGKILICVIEPDFSQILYRHYFISPKQRTAGIIRFISGRSSDIKKCHRKSAAWLEIEDRFPELSRQVTVIPTT